MASSRVRAGILSFWGDTNKMSSGGAPISFHDVRSPPPRLNVKPETDWELIQTKISKEFPVYPILAKHLSAVIANISP